MYGAHHTAKERFAAPAGARPGTGSSLAVSCAWLANTQVIKPATRMFVDDHPSRRLWEPSR